MQALAKLIDLGDVIWLAGHTIDDTSWETVLGLMEALVKAPDWFDEVTIPHQALRLQVENFDVAALISIQCTGLTINEICWLYRRTNSAFRNREIEPRLRYLNNWLATKHHTCNCVWSWSRYSGWAPLRAGDAPPWGSVCPYDKLSQELQRAWESDGNSSAKNSRPSRNDCVRLERLSQQLAECALISQLRLRSHGYSIEWNIPVPLQLLMDALTTFSAELELKQGIAWLTGVEEGRPPWEISPLNQGAQLSIAQDRLFFTRWLPVSGI